MSGGTKIYILTNFSAYLKSYSPIIVVQSQIEMLTRAGYDPILITNKGWNPPESSIFMSIRNEQLTPVNIDGTTVDEQFEREVDTLYSELKAIIEPGSVVFTHDLIFLPDYVKHNVASRRLATESPSTKWLHWIHSATSPGILIQERAMYGEKYKQHLSERFPNSVVAFPNGYDIPRVAANFGFEEDEVFEIPHATNPVEGMQPIVQRVYDAQQLGSAEVLMVYPLRLDRGKQPEMNIRLIAACVKIGLTAHLIICDFQSTGGDKAIYREELKKLAAELGIANNVTFLSEFDQSAQMEASHQVVLDLFTLSNVFLLPSKSETYSLVAQEAMLKGNLVILNQDFAPMRQIYGKNAIYRQFSSNIGIDGYDGEIITTHSDVDDWFRGMAVNVKYWIENDKALRGKSWVRIYRNPDYVFREFVEPLLTRETEHVEEAEILDSDARVLGAGADPVWGFGHEALSGQERPEGDQVGPTSTVS